jgi:general secretion pathway protein G
VRVKVDRRGFTLIEILVALVIITIISSVVVVKLAGTPYEGRKAAVISQIRNFQMALRLYHLDAGQYPTMEQGLGALIERPELDPVPVRYRDGGYMESVRLPMDPWGRHYAYIVPAADGSPYDIISYGRDGQPGGEGPDQDISSSTISDL